MEDHVVSGAYSYIHSSAVNALGCESGAYPGNTGIHTLWENSPLQGNNSQQGAILCSQATYWHAFGRKQENGVKFRERGEHAEL